MPLLYFEWIPKKTTFYDGPSRKFIQFCLLENIQRDIENESLPK